jgi:hypothetical protein
LQVRDAIAHGIDRAGEYSAPGTKGSGGLNWYLPSTISRSGKFRLAASMAMRTSPGLGLRTTTATSRRAWLRW